MPVKQQYRTLPIDKQSYIIANGERSALQWLAPALVRAGLVKNESWVEEHAAIAESYYFALKPQAVALATCHPLALQYLQQAPILILLHPSNGTDSTYEVSKLITAARLFQELVSQRPKLRDLMDAFKIPYVLRTLSCPYIDYENIFLIQKLYRGIQGGHISPSTVKQSLEAGENHVQWLSATHAFALPLGEHPDERFFSYLNWHLKSWGQPGYDTASHTNHIADFMDVNPRLFNPAWSVRRMLAEAQNWVTQLTTAREALDSNENLPPKDYSPWPNEPTRVDEFYFVPLRSSSTLALEGRMMHHCVASYARRVYAGQCRIYSVRRENYPIPLATVEFKLTGRVNQIKGVCNAAPPPEILAPMVEFQRICEEACNACAVHM